MKPGLADCANAVIVPHIASASLWTRSGMVGVGVGVGAGAGTYGDMGMGVGVSV